MSEPTSREFKAKVVLEATSGDTPEPIRVAQKYDVTPQQIVEWAADMKISSEDLRSLAKAAGLGGSDFSVDVELSSESGEFIENIEYGVSHDWINMKRLAFWTSYGAGFVLLIIVALMATYTYTTEQTVRQAIEQSGNHYPVLELKERDTQKLSSFGVVDADQEIYRVPIELVIEQMARDAEAQ